MRLSDIRMGWQCRMCTRPIAGGLRRFSQGASKSAAPRDYASAVSALNGLQSNFSIVEAIRKLGPGSNKSAIPEMMGWIRRIGYEVRVGNEILWRHRH